MRESWPMAMPWQRAIMLAFTLLFAWLLRTGLEPSGPGTWSHVLIPPFGNVEDEESSRRMARRLAVAFGMLDGATPIDARPITVLREDPSDRRVGLLCIGLTVAALVAGILWDLALRS